MKRVYTIDERIDYFRDNVTSQRMLAAMQLLKPTSPLARAEVIDAFVGASKQYNIDQVYLLAHAIIESNWGMSNFAVNRNNLFGYQAYDSDPGQAKRFASISECVYFIANFVSNSYLKPTGKWYNGPTLRGMNVRYATAGHWGSAIAKVANLIEQAMPEENASQIPQPAVTPPGQIELITVTNVNVRKAPSTQSPVVSVVDEGLKIHSQGMVAGEAIQGVNTWWMLAPERYVWAGAVQEVNPIPVEAPKLEPIETTPEPSDSPTAQEIVLKAKIRDLETALGRETTAKLEAEGRVKTKETEIQQLNSRLATINREIDNVEAVKTVNEGLSEQIGAYKSKIAELNTQVKNIRGEIFNNWALYEIPAGIVGAAQFPAMLIRLIVLFVSARKKPYVIGWVAGAKVVYTDDQADAEKTLPVLK